MVTGADVKGDDWGGVVTSETTVVAVNMASDDGDAMSATRVRVWEGGKRGIQEREERGKI